MTFFFIKQTPIKNYLKTLKRVLFAQNQWAKPVNFF